MTFNDYLETVTRAQEKRTDWTLGKTLYNVLRSVRSDLADDVKGTALDPSNNYDEVNMAFLQYVERIWND